MRSLLVLASAFAAPLLAHSGHGATPAHVHVEELPVDIGAWTFVVLLAVAGGLLLRARAARADRR